MSWSRLQGASHGPQFSAAAATYANNLTSGSKLIAACLTQDSGKTCTGVADGGSHAFTNLARQTLGGTRGELSAWAIDCPAADAGTKPTITATASAGTNTYIWIGEVSGLATGTTLVAMVDGTPGSNFGAHSAAGALPSPSYSSTASSEFLFSVASGGDSTLTVPSGMTLDAGSLAASGGFAGIYAAYGNSTGGSESAAWSVGSGSDQYAVILFAFLLPSSPPPPSTGLLMASIV